MIREFEEEAGLKIEDWNEFCVLGGSDSSYDKAGGEYKVYFYYHFSDSVFNTKTMTNERVCIYSTNRLPDTVVPNLRWLVPMALEKTLSTIVLDTK